MTEQLALIDVPAAPKLTPRQQKALEHIIAAGAAGVHADELGAHLHAEYRKHTEHERCRWCGETGISILKALRKKASRNTAAEHPTDPAAGTPSAPQSVTKCRPE